MLRYRGYRVGLGSGSFEARWLSSIEVGSGFPSPSVCSSFSRGARTPPLRRMLNHIRPRHPNSRVTISWAVSSLASSVQSPVPQNSAPPFRQRSASGSRRAPRPLHFSPAFEFPASVLEAVVSAASSLSSCPSHLCLPLALLPCSFFCGATSWVSASRSRWEVYSCGGICSLPRRSASLTFLWKLLGI